MIITVASTKGGVGKSTLVVNLAIQFSELGKQVFVIDSDNQKTTLTFGQIRQELAPDKPAFKVAFAEGDALQDIAESQSEKGAIVLIDSVGVNSSDSRSPMYVADLVLTTSAPTPADLWALVNLQKSMGKQNKERVEMKMPLTLLKKTIQ